jgi:hypothetical protein
VHTVGPPSNDLHEPSDFVVAVRRYIAGTEKPSAERAEFVTLVEELLAQLLARAHDLPETQPTNRDDARLEEPPAGFRSALGETIGDSDLYWLVADPFPFDKEPALVASSLTDDLTDIYLELKKGLNLWDNGQRQDALWEWRFGFTAHWGRDAANALAALLSQIW